MEDLQTLRTAFLLALLSATVACAQPKQQFADLGDFKLESGETIRNLRIGYRTFGQLNADKSNAILFPTWFSGNTEGLAGNIGADKVVDPSKYYVIAVDALGNGVTTSPSNSQSQPRMKFPKFTIRDMVNSQHKLLTEKLGIKHLKAVTGISMGGMQTFQWMVSYPDFMDHAIPIVGSPQLSPSDMILWTEEQQIIEGDAGYNGGNYKTRPPLYALALAHEFALTSPANRDRTIRHDQIATELKKMENSQTFDANDWIRQLEAMMGHDVTKNAGGSFQSAATKVKAKVLVIASAQDHMVDPKPALEFARVLNASTVVLTSDCGHLAPGCEMDKVSKAVASFLAK